MGHYDPGKKGYIVGGVVIAFLTFISLWAYVYSMNQVAL